MSFRVHIEPSGNEFEVSPEESVLEAALRQGVVLPYGCRNGACRSCKARVLAGEIHYPGGPPKGLTPADIARGDALLCSAHAVTDLTIAAEELGSGRDLQARTLPCRVAAKRQLAHDVVGLELVLPAAERLQYLPGQYVDIVLRDGRRRAFSIANAPRPDDRLELHVRVVPGGSFSEHVAHHLKERALLRIHGPLGAFYLRRDASRPAILMAGGTGFAPVKAMIEGALTEGSGPDLHLYWGVRARRDLYMDELARGWAREHTRLTYVPVLSEPAPGDGWAGRTGFVHERVLEDFPDLGGFAVYMSGPPVMVRAGSEAFTARGLEPEHCYSDSFDYAYETGHDEA
ncbi:MAG: CDP-6-deoxy-delta-3,4-glucoseen reductase [Gammaproteobacteria bacterium]|nr:CDP-6-deoxy-delta-3,4-glucoseen reductase [Gammaproteobacteria bacterium]